VSEGDADLACRFDDVAIDRHDFSPANCLTYRYRFHVRRYQRDHTSKSALADQAGCSCAESCAQDPIKCSRRPASLKMAQHDDSSLFAAEFCNHGSETFSNAAKTLFASGLFGFSVRRPAALFERTFGNDDDTEMFTLTLTHHDGLDNFRGIVRDFGNQD